MNTANSDIYHEHSALSSIRHYDDNTSTSPEFTKFVYFPCILIHLAITNILWGKWRIIPINLRRRHVYSKRKTR